MRVTAKGSIAALAADGNNSRLGSLTWILWHDD